MPHGNASQLWKNTRIHTETRELKESQTRRATDSTPLQRRVRRRGGYRPTSCANNFPLNAHANMNHNLGGTRGNTQNQDIKSIETETGNELNTLKTPVPNGAGGYRPQKRLVRKTCPCGNACPMYRKRRKVTKIQWSKKAHWNCTNFLNENDRKGADPK